MVKFVLRQNEIEGKEEVACKQPRVLRVKHGILDEHQVCKRYVTKDIDIIKIL